MDEQGRIICEKYYDTDDKPVMLEKGYDEIRYQYKDGSKPYRIEYYLNGEPVLYNDNYAAVEREYDDAGNVVLEKYFDTHFQPSLSKSGYGMIRKQYNDKKQTVWEEYYDVSGEPMINSKGVYQTAYEYNEQGKVTKEAYYDASDEPMANKNGYAIIERTYNNDGKKTSETSYTLEGINEDENQDQP